MAEPAIFPEQRFLQAVFPNEFSQRCQAALLEPEAEGLVRELRQQIDAALDRNYPNI